jgi:hypothetical protein
MPFQSPRLSAVMVGAAVVDQIEIIGGEAAGSAIKTGSRSGVP